MPDDTDTLTVLKYCVLGVYNFQVMDKFNEPDEAKRLDKMIEYSRTMESVHGKEYQQLWIKTLPLFDIS